MVRQINKHNRAVNDDGMRLPKKLKIAPFRYLRGKVTIAVITKMLDQYLMLIHQPINGPLKPCTNTFTATLGLPCAYNLEKRLGEPASIVRMKNIHPH